MERRSKLSQIKAARAIAAENARFFGELADIGPHEAMIMEVQRSQGIIVWLEKKLIRLRDEDGLPEDDILRQYTKLGIAPSVWMQLLNEERRHLVSVSAAAIKAGVAERKVKLAEDQARLIAGVMMSFIHDLELALTPAQMMAAPLIARRHLLALSSGETLNVNPLHDAYDADILEAEIVP